MAGRPAPEKPPKQWYGELAGVAATALALGVGELVAAATGGPSAPLVAVGGVAVDAAPTPVKEFAVAAFYTYDKLALQAGIVLVLAVFAAFIGVLAMRRLRYGLAGVAVFGVIGVLASATRASATWAYPLPTVAGALTAAGLLVLLRRTLPRRSSGSAQDLGDDTGPDSDVAAQEAPTPVQGARSPSSDVGISVVDGARQPPGRRRFLVLAGGAIGAAVVAVPGGRRLWAQRVAAARAAVVLPSPSSPAPPLPAKVSARVPRSGAVRDQERGLLPDRHRFDGAADGTEGLAAEDSWPGETAADADVRATADPADGGALHHAVVCLQRGRWRVGR